MATGKEIATLRGHEEDAQSVAFSPDGRTLALNADPAASTIGIERQLPALIKHVQLVAIPEAG